MKPAAGLLANSPPIQFAKSRHQRHKLSFFDGLGQTKEDALAIGQSSLGGRDWRHQIWHHENSTKGSGCMGPGVSSPICAAVCPVILGYLDDSDISRCIYIGHTHPYSRYDENSHIVSASGHVRNSGMPIAYRINERKEAGLLSSMKFRYR